MKKSIRKQLVLWLALLLGSLWLISSICGYYLALNFATDTYDRELLNSADSVVARLKIKNNSLSVDLPPAAQAILRHDNLDNFYYQVLNSKGTRLSGDSFLPPPLNSSSTKQPIYRTARVNNKKVRIVEIVVNAPEGMDEEVIVQVAQTLRSRDNLWNSIAMSIIFPQALMAILGASAVWFGIAKGLNPLKELQALIASRSSNDLSSIDTSLSPEETIPLVEAINKLLVMLQEDAKSRQRFVANASHQLRTPLAGLKTYTSLGLKANSLEESKAIMQKIDLGLERTSHLVSQLLALARTDLEANPTSLKEPIDLNFLIPDVIEQHIAQAIKKNIDLCFNPAAQPTIIHGERIGLQQMLSNLIDNAIKYSQPGSAVTINLKSTSEATTLSVSDEGPGIKPEEHDRIFERFYRGTGSSDGGSGLGLAIVKEVAIKHKAIIKLESGQSGKGTCFSLIFPNNDSHAKA